MVANHEGVPDQGGLKHGIGFGSQAANFESSPRWLRSAAHFGSDGIFVGRGNHCRGLTDAVREGSIMTNIAIAADSPLVEDQAVQLRRAIIASTIGTMIEWYDFYIYGIVTGLVLNCFSPNQSH